MKAILTLLLTAGILHASFANTPPADTTTYALTKHAAKEMGISKEEMARIDELNQERNREIRIASIVYKNHPIMKEAKINKVNELYKAKLQLILDPSLYQSYLARQ